MALPPLPARAERVFGEAAAASELAARIGSAAAWTMAVMAWMRAMRDPDIAAHPGAYFDTQVQLGHALADRYEAGGDMADLTDAITCYVNALGMPESAPIYDALAKDLGLALLRRHDVTGRLEDLDGALAAYQAAITGDQLDRADRESVQNNYGVALYRRHQLVGDPGALDEAIRELQPLAQHAVDGDNRANAGSNLGVALRARYELKQDPSDLDASVEAQRAAISMGQPGTQTWANWMTNLGNALTNRFQLRGTRQDLLEAVAVQRQALEVLRPGTQPWASAQVNLAAALGHLTDRFGDDAALADAVAAYREAIAATRPRSNVWLVAVSGLIGRLEVSFQTSGDQADLATAVDLGEQLLAATPPGSPRRTAALIQVGMVRRTRYALTADPADIQSSMTCLQEAVADDGQYRSQALSALGEALATRHRLVGDFADLDAAVELYREALAGEAAGSAGYGDVAASLSDALDLRHAANLDLAVVDESIELRRAAIATVQPGSAKWIRWHGSLADTLSLRYRITDETADLDSAIAQLRSALDVPQPQALGWATAQIQLANTLIERHSAARWLAEAPARAYLDEAVTAATAAGRGLRPGLAEWTWRQLTLGDAFRHRFGERLDPDDAANGIGCYTEVLGAEAGTVAHEWAAIAAAGLGELRSEQGDWAAAATAYDQALQSFDDLYATQLTTGNRESALARIANICQLACYALARAGRLEDGVAVLERGRAKALSSSLARDRADLDQLRQDSPAIFEKYTQAVSRMREVEALERTGGTGGQALRDKVRTARAGYARAVDAVRTVPGHDTFQSAPTWADVARWMTDIGSPVVYLLTTRVGGLALLVTTEPGGAAVEAVWLDDLNGAAVRDLMVAGDQAWSTAYMAWSADPSRADRRHGWFDTIDATIRELWRLAMGPVLARLGQRGATAAILVPNGLLTVLPLHAAARADPTAPTGTRYAVDDLVLSYAPSAFAMVHARRSARAAPTGTLLVVDEPMPVSAAPLPAATIEAAAVAAMFEAPVVLSRHAATRAAVLGRLVGADVLHLACHGRTNWIDPLNSGLLLADDEWLTVGDLLDQRLSAARLACLSACETAGIGLRLPDEVVSFPAALIQAGFAGAIASQWTVSDVATAMLMQRFHALWRDRGDPATALREAQRWLRDTTNGQKAEYFRGLMQGPSEVSAVGSAAAQLFTTTVLRRGGDRDFAHPFWWAAFSLTGA